MSQNFPNPNGAPHHSPPNGSNTGVQGLMSSLISPGPGTPMQAGFPMPWLGLPDWQNGAQGRFGASSSTEMQAANRNSFQDNNEEDYEPSYEFKGDFAADHANVSATGQNRKGSEGAATTLRTSHPSMIDSSSAVKSPYKNTNTTNPDVQGTRATSNTIEIAHKASENEKKLSELRARLLAKKSKNSREISPAARVTASSRGPRSNITVSPKATNGTGTPHATNTFRTIKN